MVAAANAHAEVLGMIDRHRGVWNFGIPEGRVMPRILVVDDDEMVRDVIRERLSASYEVIDTGAPEMALSLTLAHQPDAILLDLSMPELSGFELCRAFSSLSFTRHTPIFIVSGQDERNSSFCKSLGAVRYFTKPIDFTKLKQDLAQILRTPQIERRADVRLQLRAVLKLRGKGKDGSLCEVRATTENISGGGFLCVCTPSLGEVATVEVFSHGEREHCLGHARLVRVEHANTANPRYAFQFIGPIGPSADKTWPEA